MSNGLRRTLELSGSLSGVGIVLALGVLHGVHEEALQFELRGVAVDVAVRGAVPAVVGFSTLAALSGLMLYWEASRSRDPADRLLDGPPIAAVVPVYRDGQVLEESVGTLLESNYENLEVVIAAEPDDEPTLRVARELAERHDDVRVLVNRQPGSKARAINDAVERLDVDHFCVFDADERVDPDFVPSAMYALESEGHDVFQARRVPRANGPVETLAYLERLFFHASYKLVEPLGFRYCRSASSAFTREAHEAVDGFDDMLTEDIDFAHTCFRQGLDVRQCRAISNEMEAPHTLPDMWRQRRRWRLGHIEVCVKALTGGFEPSGYRGYLSTIRICVALVTSMALVALIAKIAVLLYLGMYALAALPLVAVAVAVGPVLFEDYQRGHVRELGPAVLAAPLIYPGFGLVTIRALFEYCLTFEGEWYTVEKTGA